MLDLFEIAEHLGEPAVARGAQRQELPLAQHDREPARTAGSLRVCVWPRAVAALVERVQGELVGPEEA
ncbi:MAG: hypothetical protein ACRDP9_02010 [Kribbellaceae bacterium]